MLDAPREHRRFTLQEYLWLEEGSETRNEFLEGQIYAMTGGSLNHNRLVSNLLEGLRQGLAGGPCEVFHSDVKLYIKRKQLVTYPDLFVVCGKPRLLKGRTDTITDASIVIEVLSPSTRQYDRETKFGLYRGLASLEEYVVVAQDQVLLEQHRRQPGGEWLWREILPPQPDLWLASLEVRLSLSSIYQGVR